MNRSMLPLVAVLLLASLHPQAAQANSRGKTGSSVSGCGGCHGNNASASTSVAFSVPSLSVVAGDTLPVDFEVAHAALGGAGLNVSASCGQLVAGARTQLSANEITHTGTEAMAGGAFTFSFSWTAPASPGTCTLYGAGNAVDGNRGDSGDAWNTTSIQITVTAADCPDSDGDGIPACDGDCDDEDGAISPMSQEVCNDIDDDCDGAIDDADSSVVGQPAWYRDQDGDALGDELAVLVACDMPSGYTALPGDCDDTDPSVQSCDTAPPDSDPPDSDPPDSDPPDSDPPDSTGGQEDTDPEDSGKEGGCAGCSSNGGLAGLATGVAGLGLGLAALLRRR